MDLKEVPPSKTAAATFLYRAAEYINKDLIFPTDNTCVDMGPRTYDDRKANQLLEAKADLLVAEVRISSWEADLGFVGCQVEDSSIGGVPCIMPEVD